MDLGDNDTEREFRHNLRRWLVDHRSERPAIRGRFDDAEVATWREWSRLLFAAGYAGLTWPSQVGGGGLGFPFQAIWLEETATVGAPDHLGLIGLDMVGPTILACGSPDQQARYLEPILRCDEIWCQGFSEPGSGSDLAAAQTSAARVDGGWRLNGQKVWSSFALFADWCLLLARTNPEVPKHQGLSMFLLDMRFDGVDVRPIRQITGDAEFGEIFLTDVFIPDACLVGNPGDGWKIALTTLAHERGTHGIKLTAELEASFHEVLERLAKPDQDGISPLDEPFFADRLAELWIGIQALRVWNLRALSDLASTGVLGPESTIAKLRWSELNQGLTTLVSDALGLDALQDSAGDDGERWGYSRLRSRGNSIEAGTSEVLRNIVAERVLLLPRSR